MTSPARPPILPPSPDNVPAEMRALRRWAPWRAEWDEKKQKYVKIPHRAARPEYGLSNKNAAGWVTFDTALAVYLANRDKFAGVGYLMTGPHGITGVDLDHCVVDGVVDEWAAEVAAKLDSYTEISPSGTGLHIMVAGDVPSDWTNHDRGIEVYGGNEARFLCITGHRLPGARGHLLPAPREVMDGLAARYRKAPTMAEVEDLHLPDLLPLELLPELSELELPPHASNFLAEGPDVGDRSRQLFATAIALSQAGLQPDEVLSILEGNEHAMGVALDHRRQDYDKALRYLWKQCQQGQARGAQLTADGFAAFDELDDLGSTPGPQHGETAQQAAPGAAQAVYLSDDFDALDDIEGDEVAGPDNRHVDLAPVKVPRFTPQLPEHFMRRKPMQWLVRDLLPKAGLAVIYGASTAGKTFFALDLVAAIARGVEWRGNRTTRGRGVYIVAEGAEGFRNRMQAYCEFHGIEPGQLAIGVIPDAPNLMDKAQVKELIQALLAFGPIDFIVVDTYSRVMVGGNENDAKDAGMMVAHCARIHKITGALVILVHHSGKDPGSGARGSSVLRAAADVEVEVIRTKEYRAARVAKMKDGDDSGEYRFNLPVVELGTNEDGDPITSCVVQHRDAPEGGEAPTAEGLRGTPLAVYEAVTALLDLASDVTYADAIEAGISHLPAPEEGKRDRRRDVVIRALEKLMDLNKLKVEDNYLVCA